MQTVGHLLYAIILTVSLVKLKSIRSAVLLGISDEVITDIGICGYAGVENQSSSISSS